MQENLIKGTIEKIAHESSPKINPSKTALLCIDLVNDGSRDDGFFKKNLGFDISMIQNIENNVLSLVDYCKDNGIKVIGIQTIYDFEYLLSPMAKQFKVMGIEKSISAKGTWGAQIIPELSEKGLDLIVIKSHYSAFAPDKSFVFTPGNLELEKYLTLPAGDDTLLKEESKKIMYDYFKEASNIYADPNQHLIAGGVVNLDNFLKQNDIDTLIITGASTHVCVDSTLSAASERGYRIILPFDAVAAEGIPGEGFIRHYTYMLNQATFKTELTEIKKIIKKN